MITRVYLQGVNVAVQRTEGNDQAVKFIPTRASRFTSDPTSDSITVSDRETGNAYTFDFDQLRTKTDGTFATKELAVEYLASFVGGFKLGGDSGEGAESEKYIFVTNDNYVISDAQIYEGITFVVAVDLNENWNITIPASNTIRDDGRIYKIRLVIIGEGDESLTINIAGGEPFTKGMNSIKLYRNINDDVIIGVLNNNSIQVEGWQREGSNRIVCDVRRNSNLTIPNSNDFLEIPFQLINRQTNEAITKFDISNPSYITSLIKQDCEIKYKISINSNTPGGQWTLEAKIRIERFVSEGNYTIEDLQSSRSFTGNFGGEDQLVNGYDNVVLNPNDRVKLIYQRSSLTGFFSDAGMSIISDV